MQEGVTLVLFNTHQKLLGTPEDTENKSLALGFCCSLAPRQPQPQQQQQSCEHHQEARCVLFWMEGAGKYSVSATY